MWVPAEAPNMELAKEFIKFMYSDEVVDLMLANKVENKETGEKVATPIVSPVLGHLTNWRMVLLKIHTH